MPSPFPGMDPYLENPARWPDLHHRLITQMSDVLTAQLRPKYYCCIEERVFVDDEHNLDRRDRYPDVRIEDRPGAAEMALPLSSGTTMVAEPVVTRLVFPEETHEARVEIISADDRSVITVLEVLSPINKTLGTAGRASFQEKRQEILRSPSHWVEIDLLRHGTRMTFADPLPPCHYAVHVSRAPDRPQARTWPILLSHRLPSIAVPLKCEDPDTPLDLQNVLDIVYDRAAYDLRTNYQAEPIPPLGTEDAAWVHQWLHGKGMR